MALKLYERDKHNEKQLFLEIISPELMRGIRSPALYKRAAKVADAGERRRVARQFPADAGRRS